MAAAAPMSLPGVQMVGQPGMMGATGVPGGMMGPGAVPGVHMMMGGSIPAAPLPVSNVPVTMQPGMMPSHGMGGMPVASVGMALPGHQVITS